MKRQSRTKIKWIIMIGLMCSSTMVVFFIILLFQKRYLWSFISIIGAIIGLDSCLSLRKVIKSVETIKNQKNKRSKNQEIEQ
ncbi:hypothetical protein A5844_000500 [Enterococcus sp. 10A9_DIV0425]|uniref:Uncharacterized protein n=1 Tax=Candidatus Enterococcus wittei TaxID=1987383 RepID=A0A2C9XQY1_9ENTE|nr:hypothetical protein A5844_000500 [Enterococcus sp. 10A9_DIV0425]